MGEAGPRSGIPRRTIGAKWHNGCGLSLWVYFTISGRSMTSAATLGHIAFGYPSLTARHCVFCTQSRRWLVTGI